MAVLANSGAITMENFRTGPVFDFVRNKEEFLDKFKEIFREPLRKEERPTAIEFSEDGTTSSLAEEQITVH